MQIDKEFIKSVEYTLDLFGRVRKAAEANQISDIESVANDIISATIEIVVNAKKTSNVAKFNDIILEIKENTAKALIILIDISIFYILNVCDTLLEINERYSRLYTPTLVEKIDDCYFIVDCWHNRIIWSKKIQDISEWKCVSDKLAHPHSICKLGDYFFTEDTENNRICIYSLSDDTFVKIHEIYSPKRPHRIIKGIHDNTLICLLSESQNLLEISLNGTNINERIIRIDGEMIYPYIRSVRMIDNKLWVPTTKGIILILDPMKSYAVIERIYLPSQYVTLNDVIVFNGKVYVSSYGNRIKPQLLFAENIQKLRNGEVHDIYESLGLKGVPYFFSVIDDELLIPEIDIYNRVCAYKEDDDGRLYRSSVIFDFGKPLCTDIKYKDEYNNFNDARIE